MGLLKGTGTSTTTFLTEELLKPIKEKLTLIQLLGKILKEKVKSLKYLIMIGVLFLCLGNIYTYAQDQELYVKGEDVINYVNTVNSVVLGLNNKVRILEQENRELTYLLSNQSSHIKKDSKVSRSSKSVQASALKG